MGVVKQLVESQLDRRQKKFKILRLIIIIIIIIMNGTYIALHTTVPKRFTKLMSKQVSFQQMFENVVVWSSSDVVRQVVPE